MKNTLALAEDRSSKEAIRPALLEIARRIADNIEPGSRIELDRGDIIVRENDFDRSIFYLERGEAKLVPQSGGSIGKVNLIREGAIFGLAVYPSGGFRRASVFATRPSVLLKFACSDVKKFLSSNRELEEAFREACIREKLDILLGRSILFSRMGDVNERALRAGSQLVEFKRGENIAFDGNDHAFLLFGQIVIKWRESGEEKQVFMGENDLWWHELYGVDGVELIAQTDASVLKVPSSLVQRLFYNEKYFRSSLKPHVAFLKDKIAGVADDLARRKKYSFLIEHGLSYAEAPPIIDLSRCIRCHSCENACRKRHGVSRISIDDAVKLGIISFPRACHKCRVPSCIPRCKKGAMERVEGGEVIIDPEVCIGCSACAKACPYDSIQMIPREIDLTRDSREGGLVKMLVRKENSAKAEDRRRTAGVGRDGATSKGSSVRASKCDHCYGYSHQACVRECPTGALTRRIPLDYLREAALAESV